MSADSVSSVSMCEFGGFASNFNINLDVASVSVAGAAGADDDKRALYLFFAQLYAG